MSKIIINKKTIREGVALTIGAHSKMYLRASSSLFFLSAAAANYFNIDKIGYLEVAFSYQNNSFFLKTSTEKDGFKVVKNSDNSKKNYRFSSKGLRKILLQRISEKQYATYVFLLEPNLKNKAELKLADPFIFNQRTDLKKITNGH